MEDQYDSIIKHAYSLTHFSINLLIWILLCIMNVVVLILLEVVEKTSTTTPSSTTSSSCVQCGGAYNSGLCDFLILPGGKLHSNV
jgi:hypothetical protein